MTHQQNHILYVPGIHDDMYHAQSLAVLFWRLLGVHGHCHVMPWIGGQSYELKLQRLRSEVDHYQAQGHRVSLVGASAGATAILNLYVERPDKLDGIVLICPKINHPETVGAAIYNENPAYRTALATLQPNLARLTQRDKHRIIMYYSPKDGVVPYEDSRIPGVTEYRLPAIRHGFAILYAITFGFWRIHNHLKHLPVDKDLARIHTLYKGD